MLRTESESSEWEVDYESAFPKGKRKKDRKVLAEIRKRPCLLCFKRPTEAHHVVTRGAGGDDSEENCIALCSVHHREIHKLGVETFADRYQAFRAWREGMKK